MKIQKDTLSDIVITMVVLFAALLSLYFGFQPLEAVERFFYDFIVGLKSPAASGQVVLIGIDDKSIEQTQQWPLQRSLIAEAVNTIESLGAKAVVLEILYSEKDRNPGLIEIRRILKKLKEDPAQVLKQDIIDLFPYLKISKSEQKRYSDALLNASVAETQRILIALLSETEKRIDFDNLFTQKISGTKNLLMPVEFSFGKKVNGNYILPPYLLKSSVPHECSGGFIAASAMSFPLESFAEKAYGLGHINTTPDQDGILRQHQLFICYMDRLFPSLALQAALKNRAINIEEAYKQYITNNNSKGADIFINYDRAARLAYYSFSDLLSGSMPSDKIRDKIVIIGINNPKFTDAYKLAQGKEISSIFVHGAVIESLISKDFITRPYFLLFYEAAFICFLAFFIFMIAKKWFKLMALSIFLTMMWTALSVYMLLYENMALKVSYPWALTLLLFAVYFISRRLQTQERLDIKAKDILETESLRFIIGAKSDIGRIRQRNEDSFCIDKSLGILAVADGVGGHASGEIASKMALDVMRDFIRGKIHSGAASSQPASTTIREAVQAANEEIVRSSSENPQLKGMATTLTAAYIKDNRIVIGHVGDSRIYLLRGGRFEQLTEDHTVATQRNLRSLSDKDAQRMRHVLTRAIGIQPFVEVDTYELNITKGDVLVLCTDGLYSMVSDKDIEALVHSYMEPEKACGALVNEANRAGGKDNITIIIALIISKD